MYKSNIKYEGKNQVGVIITNLGTPDEPTKKSLAIYLKEFLSDTRVVEPPPNKWIWWLILNLVILRTRPKKSAKLYKSIWGKFGSGSPLLDISKQQLNSIKHRFLQHNDNLIFELGMRYGNPSIACALQKLEQQECNKIIVLPLYPQYASATTGSTFDAISIELQKFRRVPELIFINNYHDNILYIEALANSVKEFQKQHGKPDLLIMSYHGIPIRYFDNGDIYPCHCCKTSYLLAQKLNLKSSQYKMSFQSRFGKEEWIGEYTDEVLSKLPSMGINKVQIICPGFAADCLETIEEIAQENKKYFIDAGGSSYEYIPALNVNEKHIDLLVDLINSYK